MGMLFCSNTSDKIINLSTDWQVQFLPVSGGNPMRYMQMGLNTVLAGESRDVNPVFYLTGGPQPSNTPYPGLSTRMLLLPGTQRQVTWVLASEKSIDFSFQQARQFSSYNLENEQLKVEMADTRDQIQVKTGDTKLDSTIHTSQLRACQFVMPPVANHHQATFVTSRNPETGFYPKEEILEVFPEWMGQTLHDLWSMKENLLPGQSNVIKGFLQNMLDTQQPDGRIDYRVSINHVFTGLQTAPFLACLSWELHQYLNDPLWLRQIFPQLLAFFKTWINFEPDLHLAAGKLVHPIQLGFTLDRPVEENQIVDYWIRMTGSNNTTLLSLLCLESASLISIARTVEDSETSEWLSIVHNKLLNNLATLLEREINSTRDQKIKKNPRSAGQVLCEFKTNHTYKIQSPATSSTRLYLKIHINSRLSPDFSCEITGTGPAGQQNLILTYRDIQRIGGMGFYVSSQHFTKVENVIINNLAKGNHGCVGFVDTSFPEVTQLVALAVDDLPATTSDALLGTIKLEEHFGFGGITLMPADAANPSPIVPAWIAGLMIHGLLVQNKLELAEKAFDCHFQSQAIYISSLTNNSEIASTPGMLFPVNLYLKVLGVSRFTDSEVIFLHSQNKLHPVTVQYKKASITLKPGSAEIHSAQGERIILSDPGKKKVIL